VIFRTQAQVSPKAGGERAEPGISRSAQEPLARPDGERIELQRDLDRLARLIERQAAQLMQCQQSLTSIQSMLSVENERRAGSSVHAQLESINARLRQLEGFLRNMVDATPAGGPAPPVVRAPSTAPAPLRPARGAAETTSHRVAPTTAARETVNPKDLSQDFPAAFRDLASGAGVEHADKLLVRIEAGAREQNMPWDSRCEALTKLAFGLLPKALNGHAPVGPLQKFVARLLGPGATLITPRQGDAFEPSIHQDCSAEVTGTRSRVNGTIFPGVRLGERVLVRALVQT